MAGFDFVKYFNWLKNLHVIWVGLSESSSLQKAVDELNSGKKKKDDQLFQAAEDLYNKLVTEYSSGSFSIFSDWLEGDKVFHDLRKKTHREYLGFLSNMKEFYDAYHTNSLTGKNGQIALKGLEGAQWYVEDLEADTMDMLNRLYEGYKSEYDITLN